MADMDKYKAVEYLFDCRTDRPSCDDTVFWRETGMKEDEEEVDSRDMSGMMATDMMNSEENRTETKVRTRVVKRLATVPRQPSKTVVRSVVSDNCCDLELFRTNLRRSHLIPRVLYSR